MIHRPYSLRPRAGRRLNSTSSLPSQNEGARNAGSSTDPRTSTPRDIEACRSHSPAFALSGFGAASRKSAKSPASRARCLRFAPRWSRWETCSFAASVTDATTPHREAPAKLGLACPDRHARRPTGPSGGPGVRTARRTQRGLDRRSGVCVASPTPRRPPHPAPRLTTLIKRPS